MSRTKYGLHVPHVPAKPFADWLDRECDLRGAAAVAEMIGWTTDGKQKHGERRVFRYRHRRLETARGRKGSRVLVTFLATEFPRPVVEDACDRVHRDLFYSLYPEYQSECDVELEPDAWCPYCYEFVTPIDGFCPFCQCDHGHLFREVGVTVDGVACLACTVAEHRERERRKQAARKLREAAA